MTRGQELKKEIADNIISLSKEMMLKFESLIERYELINESFNGINYSKNLNLLTGSENVLLYGGAFAGKTFACIEKIVLDANQNRLNSVFILNDMSLLRFKGFDYVKNYCIKNGIVCDFFYNYSSREIIFKNGAKIQFKAASAYINEDSLFFENIFIDEIEEVKESDIKRLIKKTKYKRILATVSNLNIPLSQYTIELFPIKKKLTIEDNSLANERDYKLLDALKDIDINKYQQQRNGISEYWK